MSHDSYNFGERSKLLGKSLLALRVLPILRGSKEDADRSRILSAAMAMLESAKRGLEATLKNPSELDFVVSIEDLENYGISFPYFGFGKDSTEFDPYINLLKSTLEGRSIDDPIKDKLIGYFSHLIKWSRREYGKYIPPAL
ncbi:hypothetical protein J4427_00195 [Candidatus Woesearchaeota archaeon]|nr:hypothetical protein [Candidatus Woesearchaeota archaeon]